MHFIRLAAYKAYLFGGSLYIIYTLRVKAGELQIRLVETNRWWRGPDWEKDDPNLRAASAASLDYRAGSLGDLTDGGLYVLRGPRRVGKSTEIKYAIRALLARGVPPRNIIHASMEEWRAQDLRTLVSMASRPLIEGTEGVRYWFLDEVTSTRGDWPNAIKYLRDNDRRFGADTVVLTGSSAAGLADARKALAGRRGEATKTDRVLLPMRFTDVVIAAGLAIPEFEVIPPRELASAAARAGIDALIPYLSDLVPIWEAYLRIGGFPQAVAAWRDTGDVSTSLLDSLWDVIHGDALTRSRLAPAQTLTLLARLARNLCSPLNVADLARDVDVAQQTAGERLTDLADHFLIWPCYREQGLSPKPAAQRKWYFIDPLLARLAAIRGLGAEPDFTQLSEQQLGVALVRSVGAGSAVGFAEFDSVLHYRSATGAEIDFVGRQLSPVALESKYVDDRWAREMQTIRASPWFGVLASRSGLDWREDGWVVPIPILVLLLGA